MKIEMQNTLDLIPYENNPRINDEALRFVKNSIDKFGFRVPIVVDKNNVVVAGHTRLLACVELGIQEVPTVRADDLTEEQVAAYRLADNKVSEYSNWDFMKLDRELSELGIDMSQFGFEDEDEAEFDGLFDEMEEKEKELKRCKCPHCGEWTTI